MLNSGNMSDKEIVQKLKPLVKPYVQNEKGLEGFDESTDFLNDLEINSANLVDVILDVEDEFDITIDNESMNGMLTVGDAKNIIRQKMAEK